MTPKKDNTGYVIMTNNSHLFMRIMCHDNKLVWTWLKRIDDATRFKHIRNARAAYIQTTDSHDVTIIPYREAKRIYG